MARYKLVYFVPLNHLSQTKTSIFRAGAGTVGAYKECAFVSRGMGEYQCPLTLGPGAIERGLLPGKNETVEEYRVEVVCNGEEQTRDAVKALKETHPYDEVAYDVYKIEEGF